MRLGCYYSLARRVNNPLRFDPWVIWNACETLSSDSFLELLHAFYYLHHKLVNTSEAVVSLLLRLSLQNIYEPTF